MAASAAGQSAATKSFLVAHLEFGAGERASIRQRRFEFDETPTPI